MSPLFFCMIVDGLMLLIDVFSHLTINSIMEIIL